MFMCVFTGHRTTWNASSSCISSDQLLHSRGNSWALNLRLFRGESRVGGKGADIRLWMGHGCCCCMSSAKTLLMLPSKKKKTRHTDFSRWHLHTATASISLHPGSVVKVRRRWLLQLCLDSHEWHFAACAYTAGRWTQWQTEGRGGRGEKAAVDKFSTVDSYHQLSGLHLCFISSRWITLKRHQYLTSFSAVPVF